MKIFITGHKGFIGSYLYDALKPHHEVIGFDLKDGIDALYAPVSEVDVVYHLAAQTSVMRSVDDPLEDAKTNILVTLDLILKHPNARFIYTASGGASEQGEIRSPYGLSKKVAGDYVKLLHKDYVICNLPNVYGRGGNGVLEKFLSSDRLTIYGDGTQTRDFVHVSDIVCGVVDAINWPKGEYCMGSGVPVKINDVAKATRKPIHYAAPRAWELDESVVINTTPDWSPKVRLMEYLNQ